MNELEIREYILNIINTKAEDIENHGGITLCFNNRLNDNLFFGQIIKEEQALINAIKCLREELKDKYIIDLESSYTSMFKLAVYHVIFKKINRIKIDSLNNTKEDKNMKKVDIELYQYENLVFGKVLHVDKELIGNGTFIRNNSYYISSGYFPSIHDESLTVWGLEEWHNNDIIFKQFKTTAEATAWVVNIKALLDELNGTEKAEGKVEKVTQEGVAMKNLNELKDALLIIKNYCTDRACKECALSSNDSCILTLNTPQDWTILDEPVIKIMTDE